MCKLDVLLISEEVSPDSEFLIVQLLELEVSLLL